MIALDALGKPHVTVGAAEPGRTLRYRGLHKARKPAAQERDQLTKQTAMAEHKP
jgi:hypothetical protein